MQLPHFSVSRFGTTGVSRSTSNHHIHNYELEFYTEDYPGGAITDGVFSPAKKGNYSLYRPGQLQSLVPPYRCYFLNISTEDPTLCEFFDAFPSSGPVWNMDEIIAEIQKMQRTEDPDSLSGRLRITACVARILSLLADNPHTDKSGFVHREDLKKADRYIREHLAEDLSLAVLAQVSNLDPTYFHKLYTRVYGKTPAQRVLSRRITAAQIALEEGNLSIAEIATKCGFSSQTYFACKFRELTGKTPTQYRKYKQNQR